MAMEMEENDAIPASDASAFRAVVPNAFPAMAQDEEEEEDEDVCRICRNPGDSENPLRYPCACSGSIKYVHQECLLQWLNHSNARHCEVCKHAFSFSPVYAKNAPARLPLQEFILGMAMKACRVLQFFLRLVFVLSVWLLIIPFITFWIWRMAFVRSFGEAHKLFLSHLSATVVLTNCLHGFLLSASIVFIFLGATSLRDYFRHLRELGGMDAEREDEGQERPGAHAIRRHPAPVNRNNAGEANGEEVGGAQGIVGAGQILRRNAENVAARLEMQAARLEAHVEQMFDGLDDADGAEDVPFDELVGMQGPVFHLVENAITVLASNGIFLAVVIFMPFSVGRVIIYYASGLFAPALNPILSSVITHMDSANVTLQNGLSLAESLTSKNITEGVVEAFTESLVINATGLDEVTKSVGRYISSDMLKGTSAGTSRFSDVTTLAIGYMFVFSLVFIYLGFVALVRYVRGEPSIMGRFYGITSILEAIPSFLRQVVVGIRHLMTMVKVAFLLVIELGVFPLMCGWWLDFCTIRMLGATIAQRVEFFSASPLASSLIHWLVGIVYMLQISIFVSLLRGVLRTGVLYFLRDPADPNYNPFRDLIDDPVHKHARRVLLSVAVYGSLIVMLIFLPVKLAMRVASSMFPLDIAVSDPFTEIPADMLLFQICIPFAIEHFKPRATIKSLLHQWFSTVGWVLGLTEFLLPRPDNVSSEDNGNIEQVRPNRFNAGGRQNDLAPVVEDRTHANRSMDVSDDSDREDQLQSNYGFVFRIVLLLVMAWITLLLFNTAVIVIPVSIGRALFNSIPRLPITHGIKCNDLYSFNIGCYIIWTAVAGIRYITDYIKSRRAGVLLGQIWKWFGIVVKSSALLSIWIFVIPVLIGLLFELLVIVPIRVPVDESPVFLLYQDWAFGLIFLKIWTRLIMMDHMAPLVDENWKMKFERVKADGFSGLRGLWVLREIVIPITMKLLMALCVPYVFAKGVFPVLGYPLIVNSTVYRFSWLGCLIFYVAWFCVKRFHVWFTNLHNTIRDDRYLIGKRLHNFGEDIEKDEPDTTLSAHQSGDGSIQNEREADIGLRLRRANR